jgi:prevent-host-death family protein
MAIYSVADAKTNLPRLIDMALGGEEVVITRHGKPVAELRPVAAPARTGEKATYEWLWSRRLPGTVMPMTSVELLNLIYEEPD